MKYIYYIFSITILLAICGFTTSCDVHQFPEKHPFALHLKYDAELPLYKIIELDPATRNDLSNRYDIRYTVNVYRQNTKTNSDPLYQYVFTKDDISQLNNTITLRLIKGNYRFVVWTDYVNQDSQKDLIYDTYSFNDISLSSSEYVGGTDLKDCYEGIVESEVSNTTREAEINMQRPVGKYKFISTDIEEFKSKIIATKGINSNTNRSDENTVNLSDYKVYFRYNGYFPTNYNILTSKPIDSKAGIYYISDIRQLNDSEVELGFDYAFVNGTESTLSISLEIHDAENNIIAHSSPINVPIVRGKQTIVKSKFLTSDMSGGVAIIPDYDGEFNFIVK